MIQQQTDAREVQVDDENVTNVFVLIVSEAAVDGEKSSDADSDSNAKEVESEVEVKEDETTPASEATSEQPKGLGDLSLTFY